MLGRLSGTKRTGRIRMSALARPTSTTAGQWNGGVARLAVLFALLSGHFYIGLQGAGGAETPTLRLRFCFSEAAGTTTASEPVPGGVPTVLHIVDQAGAPRDYHGGPGSGVGGAARGSRALDFSANARQGGPGPVAAVTNASLGLGDVTAFTATLWFKQDSLVEEGVPPFLKGMFLPRLLVMEAADKAGLPATTNSIELRFASACGLHFRLNGITTQTRFPYSLPTQRWQFAAMVYDGTNLMAYQGAEDLRATLISTTAAAGQTVRLGTNGALHLGNGPGRRRGFDGWLADFRFYSGAADAGFVERVRQAAAGTNRVASDPRLAKAERRDDPSLPTSAPGTWVAATAPAFRAALGPLIEHRRAQGFRVSVIETTDVLSGEEIWFGQGAPLQSRIGRWLEAGQGPKYVLLAGVAGTSDPAEAGRIVVPTMAGKVGVMKGLPSDYAYGLPSQDGKGVSAAAVGRFPARTVEEMQGMVRKTLAFERESRPGAWRNRVVFVQGNPGAGAMGDMFVEQLFAQRLGGLPEFWSLQAVCHNSVSAYYCPDDRLHEAALDCLQAGALFSVYLGHSGPEGLWSVNTNFLSRDDWARLHQGPGQGVFFSCGCFGCQMGGSEDEGYGLAAMRNRGGPVAVIGASGESYSAAGLLAVDGLLWCWAQTALPARLADYWLAVQGGLAQGPMDELTFALLDKSDGSGGKVPLAEQRREDLEMWMLLGDPALGLPVLPADVSLEAAGPVGAGRSLAVSGVLPARLAGAALRVTLERPLASHPADLGRLPADTPENRAARDGVADENRRRANQFVLAAASATAEGVRFKCALAAPDKLSWPRVVVRAYAEKGAECGQGVAELPVLGDR